MKRLFSPWITLVSLFMTCLVMRVVMAMALPLLRIPPSCLYHSSVAFLFLPSSPFSTRTPSGLALPLHRRWVSAITAFSGGTAAAAMEKTAESSEASRTRLIAQNIPWASTADDIKSLFAKHGTVLDIELSMYNSSRNRGLAFVTMASENEAVAALNSLNSYDLDGRVIKVEFARSVKKTPVMAAEPVPKYNVFVGNLARKVRSQDLREFFSGSGNVLSTKIIYHTNPRTPAGYGFISFSSKEDAEAAIATYNGKKLMGRPIRLLLGKVQADDTEDKLNGNEQSDDASNESSSTKEQREE